jgi:hypothetical protein
MDDQSSIIEVPSEQKVVIELSWRGIEERHLIKFWYRSKSLNEGQRIIRPYMIIPRKGNLELVGLPITELSKSLEIRQPGHYTISQLKNRLESKQFEILSETFAGPDVQRGIVIVTQTPPVCRFIYDDEDSPKVKAQWLKIKYV